MLPVGLVFGYYFFTDKSRSCFLATQAFLGTVTLWSSKNLDFSITAYGNYLQSILWYFSM